MDLIKGTRLLTICPTYGRPKEFKRMLDSYRLTRRGLSDIVVRLTDSDPAYKDYLPHMEGVNYVVGPKSWLIPCTNEMVNRYPGMDYYQLINDDHVYVTEGWDLKLTELIDQKNGWAIVYGKTRNMPTAEVFGGKIVSTLGFMYPPMFKHTYVDDWVRDLGNSLGLLVHTEDVLIEHHHKYFGLAPDDPTYKIGESTMKEGKQLYADWKVKHKANEISLIQAAMEKDKK